MTRNSTPYLTPEEYLALERAALDRHEYRDGQMIPMPRSNYIHSGLVADLVCDLGTELYHSRWDILAIQMRTKIPATGLYTYPDIVIVGTDEAQLEDDFEDTLLNPTMIWEVLTPLSEAYDRGEKFAHYQNLESLTDYLMVAQDQPRLEHYVRQDERHWQLTIYEGLGEEVDLPSIGCRLKMSRIYRRVEFPSLKPPR
jgi:Uma2 family endonuclease